MAVVAVFMAIGMAVEASSARGAGITVRAGRIGGVAKPIGAQTRAALTWSAASTGVGASGTGAAGPPYGTPPLLYGGGPVMHAVTTHVIAWAPAGYPFPSGSYVSGYTTFLADMKANLGGSSNISSVLGQYMDTTGTALTGLTNDAVINDTDTYPTTGNCSAASGASACLTEQQILDELANLISADALPINVNQSYIVLLPPTVDSCIDTTQSRCEDQAFCGYHSAFSIGSAYATFTLLPYTDSTYTYTGLTSGVCSEPGGPSGQSSDLANLDSIGAHELFESATDPLVGSGYIDSAGSEIGDECAWVWGPTTVDTGGGSYNQLLGSTNDEYRLQEMWSNQDNGCEQGQSSTATATITSSASPVTSSPTSFSATLSGASAAGATYEWSYLAPNSSTPAEDVSTAATPQLTLSTAGTYTVWVQITDPAGGTITGITTVTVAAAPTAAFGYTSQGAVPATNSPVSFTSTSTGYSGESIKSWSWNFGDGSTSTASDPSHTYSAPGTYLVTLTVTQNTGETAQISHTITVDAPPTSAFTWSSNPTAGAGVSFSPSASAGTGLTLSYSWNFGDSGTSTASNPSHTYASAGSYTVTLTVTQSDGLTASVQHTLTVAAATQSSSGSLGSGSSSGVGGSTGSGTSNLSATARSWLTRTLAVAAGAAKITDLLKKHVVTIVVAAPSASGRVMVTWYATVKHSRVVVARGSALVQSGAKAHIVIRLTAAGRRLLRRSKTLRITISGICTFGSSKVTATKTVTRKP